MGWTAPGFITSKRKRAIRPSKRKKLEEDSQLVGSTADEIVASNQTVHLPSGPGRRLAAVERLPPEILQFIFELSDNFHLPSTTISFCRTLASPWLYQSIAVKTIRNPSRVWFLTRLLLCRFFTVGFFKQQILHKTNPELRFTLPPELISPKKYKLAIALVDLNVAKLSDDMDIYYKGFVEKLCDEQNNEIVRRLLLGAPIRDGVDSQFKIAPRKETWDYLFKTKDIDLCVECVKEFPIELGFAEDGYKWADLASMGQVGSETIEWLMQTKNIIPPGDSLSGVFALSQATSR